MTKALLILILFLTPAISSSKNLTLCINNKKIIVETARTDLERIIGLQNRAVLEKDSGMLFIYDKQNILSFWMKDTLIPLSIAFIDKDGVITQIDYMNPFDLTPIKSSTKCKYALEMNRDWFLNNNIKPGDKIVIENINKS